MGRSAPAHESNLRHQGTVAMRPPVPFRRQAIRQRPDAGRRELGTEGAKTVSQRLRHSWSEESHSRVWQWGRMLWIASTRQPLPSTSWRQHDID